MAVSAVHGINGLVYVSGTELEGAFSFNINPTTETAVYRLFGSTWLNRVAGPSDWTGSIEGVFDQESNTVVDMVVARAAVPVLLYPKRSDLTTYWAGSCIFESAPHSAPGDNVVGWTSDFSGDGELTSTGFS